MTEATTTLTRAVPQYQAQLLDRKWLRAKLHEFYLANVGEGEVE